MKYNIIKKNFFNLIKILIFLLFLKFVFLIEFVYSDKLINIYLLYKKFFIEKEKINKNQILIDVKISNKNGKCGPEQLVKALSEVLPYHTNNCIFYPQERIDPTNETNKTDIFFIPYPNMDEQTFNNWKNTQNINKLILGPVFAPDKWLLFPKQTIWYERRFREILNLIKGVGVHTERVRDYLSQKSNTTNMINKYMIIRPCTNLKPKNVKNFNDRDIDILLFEKYADINNTEKGEELFKLLSNSDKKIRKIKYGNYEKKEMRKLANKTKFIIYFSFYDTGAIGLKEIQNFGVYAFTLQKELAYDRETSLYIPQLNDLNLLNASQIILKHIEILTKSKPNTLIIAKRNQEHNKCENLFVDLCKFLNF